MRAASFRSGFAGRRSLDAEEGGNDCSYDARHRSDDRDNVRGCMEPRDRHAEHDAQEHERRADKPGTVLDPREIRAGRPCLASAFRYAL
jgi:hypothetical protein